MTWKSVIWLRPHVTSWHNSFIDRFSTTRKGRIREVGGGSDHVVGAVQWAAALAGCKKTLAYIGWAISLLFYMCRYRKHTSHLEGAPWLGLIIGMYQKLAFEWIRTVLVETNLCLCCQGYVIRGLRLNLGCLALYMYYSNVDSLGLKNTYKDIDLLQSGYVRTLPPFENCCSVVWRASVCSITTFK